MTINRFAGLALTAVFAAPLVACNTSTSGENNLVRFQYEDPAVPLGASLEYAIAVGTRATLDVQSLDAVAGIRVRGAKLDPPEIAEVVDNTMNELVIEGLVPGEAQLTVETDRGPDIGTIRVAEAAEVGVKAIIETERVLQGGIELLTVERRDITGQILVGVAPAEFSISPEGVAEEVPGGADHEFKIRYVESGGHSLKIGDSTVAREVVTIDAVTEFDFASALEGANVNAGESLPGLIQAKDSGDGFIGGLEGVLEVESLTPEICQVRFQRQLYLPGVVVDGVAAGDCVVRGTLGMHQAEIAITVN